MAGAGCPVRGITPSCKRHGGGASSTPIEAPSQRAQDPLNPGWTLLSVLSSPGAKRPHHVFDHVYRRPLPEVPQARKTLCHRTTSVATRPSNPQLPLRRLLACISENHFVERDDEREQQRKSIEVGMNEKISFQDADG